MSKIEKGLSEDTLTGKIYDKDLFKRLIRYMKPYKIYVVISFILLLLITGTNLLAPVITQKAVDGVILSNNDLVIFDDVESKSEFITNYPRIPVTEYKYEGKYYLIFPHRKINFISKEKITELQNKEILYLKIIVLNNTDKIRNILGDVEFYKISNSELAVKNSDLEELKKTISKEELKSLRNKDIDQLKIFGGIFFLVISLQLVFTYFQVYLVNFAAQHAMYDLRRDLFYRLARMPLSFFDKNPIGRLVTRVTNDIGTLNEMLGNGLIQLIQEVFVLIGIMIAMLIYDYKLALVTFSILPVTIMLFTIFINRSRKLYRLVRQKLANINATLAEDISGFKIIQLFNQYKRKVSEFAEINREYYMASRSMMKLFAFFRPLINSTRRLAVAILLWYGGGQIIQNQISLGVFMAFLWYLDRFFEPINHLSEKFNILQAAMSGSERIFDLMDKDIEDYRLDNGGGKTGKNLKGEIEFKNVWLRYNDNGDVLKDISFKVKPGEKVALVGHTGSGKTSIISILAGLYPFQKGQILVDGRDIREYSLQEIRQNIGIVQQDVFLFSGTIKDNIVLNNQSISDEEMQTVARYVNVHDFIINQPDKYMEPVMERGSTFSVGQRQLIAFARVLAYDPVIFVLDEATSNIDTETEILIQDALKKLMQNRTSIIIAHRLSTIQHVDRIIVLHKGEIVEEGNHQELLAKEGLYYDLYRLQYQ
ncbi:MAG: ABC transporter ATP-binding protein/permease [Candidatus Cloacimonetes bacterium]|nr:ABC transporter ATP-binding protein/permease [Candidatus Cloacimonadota bacterium]MCF7815169.1 ABC transporter ATP-binding protein/permease [Candidatus Cloacimonadota bacterium]MCF7869373.1 ABC transporter ATP-binding protein/permease [Candidatus Cloacimonadota bacterium]MCF7884775.1 ABC transporter ATP-binding protein/permease [Candidatus Cloacimonadota bacterium]